MPFSFSSPSSSSLSSQHSTAHLLSDIDIEKDGGFPIDTSPSAQHWQLPFPLASATQAMLTEELMNSSDELIFLLEVWLKHMGWLWVAEYFNAPEREPSLERVLFQWIAEGKRELSTGAWAYLGSKMAHLFSKRTWPIRNTALQAIQYGHPNDPETLLSKLIRYRNHFAHGSFSDAIDNILRHRKWLWQWLSPVQEQLILNPIYICNPQTGAWHKANAFWEEVEQLPSDVPEHWTAFSMHPSGCVTQTSPLFAMNASTNQKSHAPPAHEVMHTLYTWSYFSIRKAGHQKRTALFSLHPAISEHLAIYEGMRQGLIDFSNSWENEPLPDIQESALQTCIQSIRSSLNTPDEERPRIVTLLGYPGSGKTGILARSTQFFPHFDAHFLYRIQYGNSTASLITCARYFIRQISAFLDEKEWLRRCKDKEVIQTFRELLEYVAQRKVRIFIGIDQIHLGYTPYTGEKQSIADFFASIVASSNDLSFFFTARPGYRDGLLGDQEIHLPVTEHTQHSKYESLLHELGLDTYESSTGLTAQEVHFRTLLLFLLASAPRALTVFELCDVLEQTHRQFPHWLQQKDIFTPHVERALWELRPLLQWEKQPHAYQESTLFKPYCTHFAHWLRTECQPPPTKV